MTISAFLPVYNESDRIKFILNSVSWCDEIYVLDKSSTDNTVKIAKDYGATVRVIPHENVYSASEFKYLNECTGDWVIIVTASDIIDKGLASEIRKRIDSSSNQIGIIRIPIKRYVLGIHSKKSPWFGDYINGPFRKTFLNINFNEVHCALQFKQCQTDTISTNFGYLYHLTHVSVDMMMERHIRYWRSEGLSYDDISLWPAFKDIFRALIKLIKKKTFFGGWDYIALSCAYLSYYMMSFVYKWQHNHNQASDLYNKLREKNLSSWK